MVCPEGTSIGVYGCTRNAPTFDLGATDSNGNGIYGETFFIRFPALKQSDGSEIVQCPNAFTCDVARAVVDNTGVPAFTNEDNTIQANLCKLFRDNPGAGVAARGGGWPPPPPAIAPPAVRARPPRPARPPPPTNVGTRHRSLQR